MMNVEIRRLESKWHTKKKDLANKCNLNLRLEKQRACLFCVEK